MADGILLEVLVDLLSYSTQIISLHLVASSLSGCRLFWTRVANTLALKSLYSVRGFRFYDI